jgi:hypothetical protein
MSIFAKKPDWDSRLTVDVGTPLGAALPATHGAYGIAEAIQLMRTLPTDQNGELVVRVVRATLASLNVHLPDIIEDATRRQKITQDRIAAVHVQIAELEKQLDVHGREIAALEADLKETTSVRERLQQAEKLAGLGGQPSNRTSAAGTLEKTPGPQLTSRGAREESNGPKQ